MTSITPQSENPQKTDILDDCINALAGLAVNRTAYVTTVLAAASIFWLAPRPPMVDLPQHAAQISLWHDLLTGQSPWTDLFLINVLTPYLTAYSLALGLSFIVSATTAFKILLTIGLIAFVISCVQLRREFGADERLDWVFIPSFFGFAYEWGFATFLISSPICLQFIRLARLQAASTNLKRDAGIYALGVTLLFSHGLLFLFAGLIGGMLLLQTTTSIRSFVRHAIPYVLMLVTCIVFMWATRRIDEPAPLNEIDWPAPYERLATLGFEIQSAESLIFLPLTVLLFVAILLLRPNFLKKAAIPLAAVIMVYFLVPHLAYGTAFLYQRFALFILPFIAFACLKSNSAPPTQARLCHIALMVGCCGLLSLHAQRAIAFARETVDFERIIEAAEPGRRAASIVHNRRSRATRHHAHMVHMPAWYQADKHGLVEFNFAYFHPQVVRYKSFPYKGFGFDQDVPEFDWSLPQARIYDYYIVHQFPGSLPAEFTKNPVCETKLIKSAGLWSLFERGTCKPQ
jgi:hypothetical protein